ncbi:hypothetical protein ABIB06_007840 [Bradyrhizobium sp. LB8.2]|uniref:hypothetical protein n=1 Tax=unclassified Bradyrhizobium TaxID=2631580 RepID=UPI00339790D9
MAIAKELMVEGGLRLMAEAGHKIVGHVADAHHKATVKRLSDGSSVQVRTCNLPQLPMVFTEKDVRANGIPDRLEVALSYTFVLAVIRVAPKRLVAFLIPSEIVKQYVLDQLAAGSKDLSPHLDHDIWQKYQLPGSIEADDVTIEEAEVADGAVANASTLAENPSDAPSLRDRIDSHRNNIARDAGVTPDKVRIDIDFN